MDNSSGSENYISLHEAEKYCDYSANYLRLRSRQGKLKAVKIGRDWVTKEEWIKDYQEKVNNYNHNHRKAELVEQPQIIKDLPEIQEPLKTFQPKPNFTLPSFKLPNLRAGLATLSIFTLITAAGVFIQQIDQKDLPSLVAAITSKDTAQDTLSVFKDFTDWLGDKLSSIPKTLASPFVKTYQLLTKQPSPPPEKEKIVTERIIEKETIKEVQQITRVEPTREITREVITLNTQALIPLQQQINEFASWKKDINLLQYTINRGYLPGPSAGYTSLGVSGGGSFGTLSITGDATIGRNSNDTLIIASNSNFGGPVSINTLSAVGTTTLMDGNIGIGTTSPAYGLEVMASTTDGYFGISAASSGDTFVVDASGNVGIGTTSPEAPLELVRSGSEPYFQITRYQTGEGGGNIYLQHAGGTISAPVALSTGNRLGTIYGLGYDGSSFISRADIAFKVNGSVSAGSLPTDIVFSTGAASAAETMRITNTGLVGIGTTSPAYGTEITASTTDGYLGVSASASGDVFLVDASGRVGIGTSSLASMLDIYSNSSSASSLLRIATGTTEALFVDGTGNIGIGTTSPSALLDIWQAGAGNVANFNNATGSAMFIANDGNVGIGKTNPSQRLDVVGIDNSGPVADFWANNLTAGLQIRHNGIVPLPTTGNVSLNLESRGTGDITFLTTIGSGNVGIVDSAPDFKLEVAAESANGYFGVTKTIDGDVFVIDENENVGIGTTSPAYGLELTASTTDGYLGVSASTSGDVLLVDASGRVGIGTSSLASMLDIFSNSSSASSLFRIATGTTEALFVDGAGNVGIGTVSPAGQLAVQGDTTGDITLLIKGVSAQSGNLIEVQNSAGTALFHVSAVGPAGAVRAGSNGTAGAPDFSFIGAANKGMFGAEGGALGFSTEGIEGMRIDGSQRVGIGTTSPAYGLELTASSTSGYLGVSGSASGDVLLIDASGRVGIGTSSLASILDIFSNSSSASSLFRIATGTTEALFVDGAGLVGIGTATIPSGNTLAVSGQCVTADTRLRRRRKKSEIRNPKSETNPKYPITQLSEDKDYIYEEAAIVDIQPGDEILTLNEKTGQLVWSRVNALMDMGTKPIYKLITASGKTIRTTGNHPYLARVSVPVHWGVQLTNKKSAKMTDSSESQDNPIRPGLAPNANITNQEILSSIAVNNFLGRGPAGNRTPEISVLTRISDYPRPTADSLYHSNFEQAKWTKVIYLKEGDEIAVMDEREISSVSKAEADKETPEFDLGRTLSILLYGDENYLSSGKAVDKVIFEKITKIEILSPEQVYDIEVEKTHNFVANGILAHNTYISGNVGIGTTSPAYGLELTASSSSGYLGISGSASGDILLVDASGRVGIGTSSLASMLDIYSNSSSASSLFRIATGTTEALFVDGAGNVGIGTVSPAAKFHIVSLTEQLRLERDASNLTSLTQDGNGDLTFATTRYVYMDNPTRFGSAGDLSIAQVAIGGISAAGIESSIYLSQTVNPAVNRESHLISIAGAIQEFSSGNHDILTALNVAAPSITTGVATVTNAATVRIINAPSADVTGGNYALWVDGGQSAFPAGTVLLPSIIPEADPNTGIWFPAADTFAVSTAGSERIRIDSSGNVGIGTTSPAYGLELTASSTDGYLGVSASTSGDVLLIDASGRVGIGTSSLASMLDIFSNSSSASSLFRIATGTTEAMFVDGAGNVGIGTAGPGAKLDVNGATIMRGNLTFVNDAVYDIGASGATRPNNIYVANQGIFSGNVTINSQLTGVQTLETNASQPMKFNINSVEAMRITTSGNVGIGTTSPAYGLELTASSTDGYLGVSASTSGDVLLIDASGRVGIGTSSLASMLDIYSNSSSASSLFRIATGTTEALFVDGAGNVGIGTTTPDEKLSVISASNGWGARIQNFNGSNASYGLLVNTDANNSGILGFEVRNNTSRADFVVTTAGNVGIGTTSPSALLTVHQTGAADAFIVNDVENDTAPFVIDQSGNVGIGTTSPEYPLDVLGAGTGAIIARFNDVNKTGCTLATGGTISCSSDINLKKNIEDIAEGLDKVLNLHPILFNWKTENDSNLKSLGFIAQEVELILPKLVTTENNNLKQLNTIGMIPLLTRAIQEQQQQIEELKLQLNSLGQIGEEEEESTDSFVEKFWANLFSRVTTWLADAANGVGDLFANRARAKQVCLSDESGAETCISKLQLDSLLSGGGSTGGSSSGGSAPASEPPPSPEASEGQGEPEPTEPQLEGSLPTEEPQAEQPTSEEPVVEQPATEQPAESESTPAPAPAPAPEPTINGG